MKNDRRGNDHFKLGQHLAGLLKIWLKAARHFRQGFYLFMYYYFTAFFFNSADQWAVG